MVLDHLPMWKSICISTDDSVRDPQTFSKLPVIEFSFLKWLWIIHNLWFIIYGPRMVYRRSLINCDQCTVWYHLTCAHILRKEIPDLFICSKCESNSVNSSSGPRKLKWRRMAVDPWRERSLGGRKRTKLGFLINTDAKWSLCSGYFKRIF